MNLLETNFIPVRRANGLCESIMPWQLTDQYEENPIIALNTPRPDFNGALIQFLIGLLQTAMPPEKSDNSDWVAYLESPPLPDVLKEKFLRYEGAFNLDGEGPRFMQDFDELETKKFESVSSLFLESPGENTLKNNADHFIKRKQIEYLCPACAATALFTLQANAPSGGAGHRTSLRGGGPLTTLIVFDRQGDDSTDAMVKESLWTNLWLNVLNKPELPSRTGKNADAHIFPWLTHTQTSDKKGEYVYPADTSPLQMYWGMPRRIRLDWENTERGICDVCGIESDKLLYQYKTKNYGIKYNGPWQHPLSPHRFDKDGTPIPLHPGPSGFTYRHWLSMADDRKNQSNAAQIVNVYKIRKLPLEQFRLLAFGYDMDNMKARGWHEITFPLYLLDSEIRVQFTERVEAVITAASDASGFVRTCVKDAWFKRPGDTKGDTSFLVDSFFSHTEQSFFELLNKLEQELKIGHDGLDILHNWHIVLVKAATNLFGYWASNGDVAFSNPRRIGCAHQKLIKFLYGPKMRNKLELPNKKEKMA